MCLFVVLAFTDATCVCFPISGIWTWRDVVKSLRFIVRHRGLFPGQGWDPHPFPQGMTRTDVNIYELHQIIPLDCINPRRGAPDKLSIVLLGHEPFFKRPAHVIRHGTHNILRDCNI